MKKLVFAFIFLLLILGGAVGAMKWLELGPFEPVLVDGEAALEDVTLDAEDLSKLEFDSLVINVLNGGEVVGNFQITFSIEVDKERLSELNQFKDRVHDALLTDLHSFLPRMLRKTENLDILVLGDRIELVGERIMGPDTIHQVLITSVIPIEKR